MAKTNSEGIVSANVSTINTVVTQLKSNADKLDEQISTIYSTIEDMQSCWSGKSYDEFVAKCKESRQSLDALVLFVRAYAEVLNTPVKDAADKLITATTTALGGNN